MSETNTDTFDEISKEMIEHMTDGKKQKVYELWKGSVFKDIHASITQTIYRKEKSPNSYSFCGEIKHDKQDEPYKCKLLRNIFGINTKEQKDLFIGKYNQAVSGVEGQRITTLHSSSLCCLLFFYNVTRGNPLIIKGIKTKNGERTIEFKKSCFEFKNPVFSSPSNIDVVLTGVVKEGKDKGRKVVLFLESKFSEYYVDIAGTCDLPAIYMEDNGLSHDLYKKRELLDALGLEIDSDSKTEKGYKLKVKKGEKIFYIKGIKQMVSHYLGIRNLIQDCKENNTIILLGEILFDNLIGRLTIGQKNDIRCLESYKGKYKVLVDKIREQLKNSSNFDILSEPLTYSKVFHNSEEPHHEVEKNIRRFYQLPDDNGNSTCS